MIPEAVFHEFPAKTLRKFAVSDRNPPENARNSTQESGNRIQLSVLTDSCRFRAEPDKYGHRIRLPEYHGIGRFRAGLFDLGSYSDLLTIPVDDQIVCHHHSI
jgi:hypothetical protein